MRKAKYFRMFRLTHILSPVLRYLYSRRLEYKDFKIRKNILQFSATSIIILHIIIFLNFASNFKN